jgi:spoIIIJ-associated protein
MKMTRALKFSGKTVDDAIETALTELDAKLEDVDVRVKNPGRSGILGFGGEPAEIEIALVSDAGASGSGGTGPRDSEISSDDTAGAQRRGRGSRSLGGRRDGIKKVRAGDTLYKDSPRHTGDGDSRLAESVSPDFKEKKDDEVEELVSELIDYFLGAMGVVADTYVRDENEDGSLVFEIEGEDAGLLIGRRGETLNAFQFLIRMITSRQLGRKAFVAVDVENYRERRTQTLRSIARKTAGRVASSGRENGLDPMSAIERRIVHMSLAEHPDVRTE